MFSFKRVAMVMESLHSNRTLTETARYQKFALSEGFLSDGYHWLKGSSVKVRGSETTIHLISKNIDKLGVFKCIILIIIMVFTVNFIIITIL